MTQQTLFRTEERDVPTRAAVLLDEETERLVTELLADALIAVLRSGEVDDDAL